MKISDDENVEKSETIEDFPEEPVFSIADLTQFYENFATKDPRIKEFVEKITDFIVT